MWILIKIIGVVEITPGEDYKSTLENISRILREEIFLKNKRLKCLELKCPKYDSMLLIGYMFYHDIDPLCFQKAMWGLGWSEALLRLVTSSHKQFCLLPHCEYKYHFLCVL